MGKYTMITQSVSLQMSSPLTVRDIEIFTYANFSHLKGTQVKKKKKLSQ